MRLVDGEPDNWYEEEARSITQCCGNYMDRNEKGDLICRSCKQPIGDIPIIVKSSGEKNG